MSRSFIYPEGWQEAMHQYTLTYSVGQARAVIKQFRNKHGYATWGQLSTNADILRGRFEWRDEFINDVLNEMERIDNLNSEQAFHDPV